MPYHLATPQCQPFLQCGGSPTYLKIWLGWLDLNQRMRESKSRALPLGDTPIKFTKHIICQKSGAGDGNRTHAISLEG